ncbi:hypothetical protein ACFP3U_29600 [Kitasatospora misakiensis]|uniref:Ig-like domain-containing protein n=1 Tax=Kitasatospora misakiensis TaxID=67330 RepID=A0ABW0X9C3_9ACTN
MTFALLLLGVLTGATAQAQATPQQVTASRTICSNEPVPTGWIVSASYSGSRTCAGSGVDYTIRNTAGLTTAWPCSFSPIPTGWVVTSGRSSTTCAGSGVEYTIENVTNKTSAVVCSYSPRPAGWVITGSSSSNACVGTSLVYYISKS